MGLSLISVYAAATYLTAAARGMGDLLSPDIVGYFVVYFVLGFLLVASLFAAFGSACNTVKEAQNLTGPLTIIFVIPMVAWVYIIQNPVSSISTVLSFIPPMTPMVMILRIAARPDLPVIEIALSLLVLLVSVLAVVWLAARVFRVGVLMYGKPPGLKEIVRWLRSD